MTKQSFDYVIVGQCGNLKQAYLSSNDSRVDSNENKKILYKACGYNLSLTSKKSNMESFELLHTFSRDSFPKERKRNCDLSVDVNGFETILLFGKKDGRAGLENKYEFPPPIDNEIFYGNLCLTKCLTTNSNNTPERHFVSLSVGEWKKHYEALFGGFDDCNESDVDDEEDIDVLEFISDKKKTKEGYLKDGFIVDDNVDNDEDDDEDEEDDYAETDLSDEEDFEFSDDD